MKDPVRLLTGGSPEVQDLLRSAAGDEPLRVQLDQLGARLAPAVAAPASGGLLAWLLAGSALLGGAGVVVLAHDHQEQAPAIARVEPPPSPEAPTTASPDTTEPVPPARAPTKPAATVEAPVKAPPTDAARQTPTEPARQTPTEPGRQTTRQTPEPARQTPPAIPRELELLTPAHAALHANDFARALALADRHAGLYPTGMFAEEREAIAIEALHGLGHRDRARDRLASFTTHYPHSGYRARLERAVRE